MADVELDRRAHTGGGTEDMKIYIASSWKNENVIYGIAELLRLWGHEVDAFCDTSSGRFVFHFSEIGDLSILDAITFLEHEKSQRAYAEDKKWLDWCDAVLLVLPAGRSAHLEGGYAKGAGKKLYIFGGFPKGEFDVMYGLADRLIRTEGRGFEELRETLGVAGRKK